MQAKIFQRPRKTVSPKKSDWNEHQEQVRFFQEARRLPFPWVPDLLMAIPNGGNRHTLTGMRMKAEGQRPGIPDIFLAVPQKTFHGLWIELKCLNSGNPSKDQKRVIKSLREQGYEAQIAHGWEQAWQILLTYLDLKNEELRPFTEAERKYIKERP